MKTNYLSAPALRTGGEGGGEEMLAAVTKNY